MTPEDYSAYIVIVDASADADDASYFHKAITANSCVARWSNPFPGVYFVRVDERAGSYEDHLASSMDAVIAIKFDVGNVRGSLPTKFWDAFLGDIFPGILDEISKDYEIITRPPVQSKK